MRFNIYRLLEQRVTVRSCGGKEEGKEGFEAFGRKENRTEKQQEKLKQ